MNDGTNPAPSTMGDASDTVTDFTDENRQYDEKDDGKDQEEFEYLKLRKILQIHVHPRERGRGR
jgi:hypothetical protein